MNKQTKKATKGSWYAEGLAFECTGCGDCCRGPGGYVWMNLSEAEKMAAELKLSTEAFAKKYLRRANNRLALIDGFDGNCVFLDDEAGKCKVYAARPAQCRAYPWWPEVVKSRRTWESEIRMCEGIGREVLVPLETIVTQLQTLKDAQKNNR